MQQRTKTRLTFEGVARWSHEERPAAREKGKLDRQTKLLLVVNALFVTANALSGTFVNVYLWKMKQDISLIAWYSLMIHLASMMTGWLCGSWVKQRNKMNCMRTGIAVSAVFYMIVLLVGNQAASWVIPLGIVQGIAGGLFWIAFNVVYFEATEPDNRDLFNGWTGLLGAGAGMFAPWISGILIVSLHGTVGYRLIFAISLAVFVVGAIVSFFLHKRKAQGQYEWLCFVRCFRDNRYEWRRIGAALAAQGMREGVFTFIIGLLVYISTRSEMKLGNYALITSAVSLLAFMVAGKWLKPKYRKPGMLLGASMMVAAIVVFFWKVNMTALFVFGIAVALFYPLYSIPMTSRVFDLIGQNEDSARNRVEYVVTREIALDIGRIIGVAIFLVVVSINQTPAALNWLMLAVGCSPLFAWIWMKKLFG
jgi:YQGE family putative transporter